MEPYSIPSIPAHLPSRGDDSSSDEARRDQRRAENSRGTSFRTAMERSTGSPTTPTTGGRPVATGWSSGQTVLPGSKIQVQVPSSGLRTGAAGTSPPNQDQALSPSLLKLRAATARTTRQTQTPRSAPPQRPVPGKNPGLPCPGEQPVHANPAEIPLPPAPPRHPGLRYDLAAVSSPQQMPLPQAINPAAESARLEARASGHNGDKKDNSGTSEDPAPVDSGSDRSGLSLPMPTLSPQPAPCEAPQVERVMPSTPLLQQVVEFATVAPNQQGFMEFRLGLSRNALGGMRIRVCAYGNRRVGLNVQCGEGDGAIHEGHVAGLIDALRRRDVEVVETVFE